jgi:hypothetical protein
VRFLTNLGLLPYDKNTERFGPYDFTLFEDDQTLTCLAGKQSSTAYTPGTGDGRTCSEVGHCANKNAPRGFLRGVFAIKLLARLARMLLRDH